jgi:bifunctional non-homologous end joining protein LigD
MPLETYRRKRDFGKTPEPAGLAPPPATGPPRFVVQRHRATRLHYDFRLEIDGVLVSWAVPRGPSMRPIERRMAARTEDHPIEYIDFEGVIPRGEYGAGDVIVWDEGTWEPEDDSPDPAAAIRHGELKFILHGHRLRGHWVIVRTRGDDPDKEDWLLIHKRDADAIEDWDIDAFPTSVVSGRTNDEVKEGRPAAWDPRAPAGEARIDLAGAVEAPLPDFVPPMLATPVDGPFDDQDWLFELKLDGYRVEAVVDRGKVRLWTRNRLDAARYFPELAAARPTWIAAETAVVDGEVVALDAQGRPDFSLLQDRTGLKGLGARRGERRSSRDGDREDAPGAALVYHAFDLLYHDGRSLTDVPLEERKKLLRSVIRDGPQVRYLTHIEADGVAFHAAAAKAGLEGVIAKLRRSRYEPGKRTRAWLKVKIRREQELVVAGYEPGKGTHTDLGSLIVGTYQDGRLRFAGEVGSGLDEPTRRAFRQELDRTRVDEPPFAEPRPRIPGARWSEPRQVIRAAFAEWTSDGLLRQASYLGREPGRDPRSVTRERSVDADAARRAAERAAIPRPGVPRARVVRPAPSSGSKGGAQVEPLVREPRLDPPESVTRAELEALDGFGMAGVWSAGGHRVHLTNLDKQLWPEAGYTKRDLARYYATISPVLLPYLRDRPLNTDRWPDGIHGHHFWQKQIPSHAPGWVARWDYPEAGRDQSHTYVVADRVATMAWLSNQAVIDLHPWTSRLPDYWRPTYALIDIDPGTRTSWEELLTLARLFRTALRHLGVRAAPKLTGKRGIQAWISVEPRYTYDETRSWVEGLSRAVAATVPDLVSWEWGKADRGGRARLDYTQNTPIKTLVAPYAVRPVPAASVSAPIRWDELDDPTLRPDRWDIRTIVERVEQVGDLFAAELGEPQALPKL